MHRNLNTQIEAAGIITILGRHMVSSNEAAVAQGVFVESLLTLSSSKLVLCKRNLILNPKVVLSSLLIWIYMGTQVISGDF